MNIFETIADRRIKAAQAAGLFDNLPGAGKPIPDIDHERPPGWWATRLVRRERSIVRLNRVTTWDLREPVDVESVLITWHKLRRRQRLCDFEAH